MTRIISSILLCSSVLCGEGIGEKNRSIKKTGIGIIFGLLILGAACLPAANAGFGITPPYVQNDQLTRGSTFEQQILIVRSDPDTDLRAVITVNVPDAEGWFTIEPGNEFLLPRGERRVPMRVRVRVPQGADFKAYRGNIRVVITSADGPRAGTVGIALGAQVDVNLNVVDRKIFEFRVRGVDIADLEEGKRVWWMYLPAKIRFSMNVINTGNVPAGPTRVEMDIYDRRVENLLESTHNTNKIEFIDPFEERRVVAELPTHLGPGSYRVVYRIYNLDTVVQENNLHMDILPAGTLEGYEGYVFPSAFWVLPLRDRLILGGGLLVAVILLLSPVVWFGIRAVKRRRRKKHHLFHLPKFHRK